MIDSFTQAIVLAPHTDDMELGCGGTVARLRDAGVSVKAFLFSPCEESVPSGFPKDALAKESLLAGQVLGLKKEDITIYPFRVRHFPAQRQEILEELIRIRAATTPDLVLLPSSTDIHQDHQVIQQEGTRAFKHSCILGYEMPWNNLSFSNDCFVRVEESHLETKVRAIAAYKTQEHRSYTQEAYIRSMAVTRGVQCNEAFAEAFEMIRWKM